MRGTLYGVGVGPGDPELITIKALRKLNEVSCIVIPISNTKVVDSATFYVEHKCPKKILEGSVAYNIVYQIYPEIKDKTFIVVPMPMTMDKDELEAYHKEDAEFIKDFLDSGMDMAFITLGDPTVYSTYMYIHNIVKSEGYPCEIISGVTSFCAAAGELGEALSIATGQLHIFPTSEDTLNGLDLPGTKVFMKSGTNIEAIKEAVKAKDQKCMLVERCGMEGEAVYKNVDEIPSKVGYYSVGIVGDFPEEMDLE